MVEDLRTLPRKLAEGLISETDNFGDCSLDIAIAKAEAVILEAIEQTLEEAAREIEEAYQVTYGNSHDSTVANCREAFAAAIRSLKPVKSGD